MKKEWAILYADGSTFSNLDGEPHEAPRHGVQMTFWADEETGVCIEDSPIGYWYWRSNRWFGCDDHMGFWDHMFHSGEPVIAVFGRTLHDDEWQQDMLGRVKEIMGEPKSAWRKRERRSTT